jgi:hypothetical protein
LAKLWQNSWDVFYWNQVGKISSPTFFANFSSRRSSLSSKDFPEPQAAGLPVKRMS